METISKEDMEILNKGKATVQNSLLRAEKVAAEAKIADLEYRMLVQHIFLKYNMGLNDTIDDSTGEIKRKDSQADTDPAPAAAPTLEIPAVPAPSAKTKKQKSNSSSEDDK